ncbi:MAG TPA: hypothetical protein PK976_00145 [Bacteroidales bacterium]|nr:hypothetical protein [Bacteroidales bacterium]
MGYGIEIDGTLTISGISIKRFKDKIHRLTQRNRGRSIAQHRLFES